MKKSVLVFAPHPDDETLGCGGTLFKLKQEEDMVLHWVIVTQMGESYSEDKKNKRKKEIEELSNLYGFKSVIQLKYDAAEITSEDLGAMTGEFKDIIKKVKPEMVFFPFFGDAHTDHQWIAKAVHSASKVFRSPSVKKLLSYEVLSETNFSAEEYFVPSVYFDISNYLTKKMEALKVFDSEFHPHPFPRSYEAVEALAKLRGSEANCQYAESFRPVKIIY